MSRAVDTPLYLGIEIGGSKLQLGIGSDNGRLLALWRDIIDPQAGADGIRTQIQRAIPKLLAQASIDQSRLKAVGIGFGGPVDDATQSIIRSHHVAGWDGFPLADWVSDLTGLPAVLGNDADVAGLAEARHGAGKGLSPIFYITIGSGIGGGLIIDEKIYRGCGRGAAEVGHLSLGYSANAGRMTLESRASGWAIERRAQSVFHRHMKVPELAELASAGDPDAESVLAEAIESLADAISSVIVLLCPRRIVIGGGVSLLGNQLFVPLREMVTQRAFEPFAGLTDIVPAALGEEVVVHGAIALARNTLG